MSAWDDDDLHTTELAVSLGGGRGRRGGKHHMRVGELKSAKRKLREMQGARDRERGRKVRVCGVCTQRLDM